MLSLGGVADRRDARALVPLEDEVEIAPEGGERGIVEREAEAVEVLRERREQWVGHGLAFGRSGLAIGD